jgi:uncharacterized protein involved in exopolysaccharide biosynthesis
VGALRAEKLAVAGRLWRVADDAVRHPPLCARKADLAAAVATVFGVIATALAAAIRTIETINENRLCKRHLTPPLKPGL